MTETKDKIENIWKCSECKGVFTDSQSDGQRDDRCPLCFTAFEQMPYEAPHLIARKDLVTNEKDKIKEIEQLLSGWVQNPNVVETLMEKIAESNRKYGLELLERLKLHFDKCYEGYENVYTWSVNDHLEEFKSQIEKENGNDN